MVAKAAAGRTEVVAVAAELGSAASAAAAAVMAAVAAVAVVVRGKVVERAAAVVLRAAWAARALGPKTLALTTLVDALPM